MSTSLLYQVYNIKGVIYKSTQYLKNKVIFYAEISANYPKFCSKCNSNECILKDKKKRLFYLIPFGRKKCFLSLQMHKMQCKNCNHKWWIKLPFMRNKSKLTKSFVKYVLEFAEITTIKFIAKFLNLNWNTVKNIHKTNLEKTYKRISLKEITTIAMDEFSIRKGHSYITIFIDLKTGRIIHAVEGRSKEAIFPFLKKIKKHAKNLKAIAMDMSGSYYSAVKEVLNHIDIVFDHFHAIALMNKAIDELRREESSNINSLKGVRFLLLKNYDSLDTNGMERLNALLAINQPLFIAHALKEQLRLFWDKKNYDEAKIFLEKWCLDALLSNIRVLVKIAKTFHKYSKGLLNYFKYRISTGTAEGINNKIKTMKRQAYGYRDFEYFKLKLYDLHNKQLALI